MKIKTRFYGNLVLGIGLAIMFALILVWSFYQIDSELVKSETANILVRETTDLIMIGEEYLVYRYPRTILQWKAKYDKTMAALKDMKKSSESDRIKKNLITLNKSFLKLKENFLETKSQPEKRLSQAYLVLDERLSGQMRILSRNIIGNALKLSMEATNQTRRIVQKDNVVLFVFLGLFILLTAASLFSTIKKNTMSLAGLERDANIINSGNLKHKISTSVDLPNGPRDEIEELSQSFSNMTGRLVKSIEKLETEVTKRTEAEDKLKKAHDGLEKEVEKRTKELAKTNNRLMGEIEDRKQAEEALQESEELHKEAQKVAHIGHWELSPEIGTPVWSDEIFRIFGLNPQESEPSFTDHETHLHPDDWPLLNKAVTLGSTEGTPFDIIFRIVRPDGEIRWMHAIGTPTKDEKGKVTKLFGTAQNITDRKRAEEALQDSEEKYRLLADNVSDMIWMMDIYQQRLTYISPSVKRMRGYSPEEAMDQPLDEILTPESYQRAMQTLADQLSRDNELEPDRFINMELEQYRRDGTAMWTELRASFVRDSEKRPIAVLGITRDITERKQAEEEKTKLQDQLQHAQRMESIGTLAGGIAHNFNNLLMGIQGNASIMFLDIDSSHPRHKNLKSIEKLVDNGAKLSAQLIGYAREGKYEVKPISLNQLVKDTSDTFGMTKREITVHQDLSERLYGIEADQGQIEQILLNLYVNAVEAMPGGGDLFLKTMNVTDKNMTGKLYKANPGNYVLLTVRDTGIGMDKETRERIFEPFFTTKGLASGTGLGMASAYGIIKGHGGYVDVDSEKRKGTTFSIYLPATEEMIEQKNVLSDELVKGKGTVLLVDDEEMVLEVGKELLDHLGYEVLLAENGREALELYKKNLDKIDLVLLDMVMPVMGGGKPLTG